MTIRPADTVASTTSYRARLYHVASLSEDDRATMSALYLSCYAGSSDALFRRDLANKDHAIVLHVKDQLVGFTTVKTYPWTWCGMPITIVYSGDTIVAPRHWGQQTLAFAWLDYIGRLKRSIGERPLYWFLLVKGHRTYKYLSVFAKQFHPHWSQQHADWKALADALALEQFGKLYDPMTGVVRFANSRGHLRPALAEAMHAERARPATRFFLARNPGYRQGDELVCLCPLDASNMKPLAARLVHRVIETGTAGHLHD